MAIVFRSSQSGSGLSFQRNSTVILVLLPQITLPNLKRFFKMSHSILFCLGGGRRCLGSCPADITASTRKPEDNLQKPVLPCLVGPGEPSQVVELGGGHPYLLRSLTGSNLRFSFVVASGSEISTISNI